MNAEGKLKEKARSSPRPKRTAWEFAGLFPSLAVGLFQMDRSVDGDAQAFFASADVAAGGVVDA